MSGRVHARLIKALPGFTLDVAWDADDPVVALFGPSGAGKTLTLQCLAGLARPDSGHVEVDGRVFFDSATGIDVPPQQRGLGYVFQGYALFPHLSVAGNVGFGIAHWPRERRRARVGEVLERLGLAALAERRPRELSGGQQQRVALGRALAPDPALLLLDEPLSALDGPLRRAVRAELGRIIRDFHIATVLVTHDLAEAFELADRIVVYDGGRIIQSAPKSEVLSSPASGQVARLIGIRNILAGVALKATPEIVQLRWKGYLLEAINSTTRRWLPSAEAPVTFFVRPEYVRLVRKDRLAPRPDLHHMNLMEGRVVRALDQGTSYILQFLVEAAPGGAEPPAQGDWDLEIEVPRLVYEMLDIAHDARWQVSMHRGAIHVLPGT
jgi:molybdate transport system ATP-binding protein